MFTRSIRKFGIGAASVSLAVSVLFPSASYASAGSFLPAPPNLQDQAPQLNPKLDFSSDSLSQFIQSYKASAIKPQNYAGTSTSSAPVTFIVQLQKDPIKVAESQSPSLKGSAPSLQHNVLRTEHSAFKAAADLIGAVTGHEYTEVFNGYEVTLPGNQVDKLLALPGVKAVFPNTTVHALETATDFEAPPSSGGSAQVPVGNGDIFHTKALYDKGATGEGIEVAVIDTGIDYDHPYLKGVYKGGYDVVDNDEYPFETKPDPRYLPRDGKPYETAHGSHVSGIVHSVAPKADIYVYRVLGPYGSGSTADVIEGIELAVAKGVDVINLSLGSDVNQQYSPDAIAVDNAAKAGVTVVLASGNAGPGQETVGTPGGAHRTISVGASTTPTWVNVFKVGVVNNVYGIQAAESAALTASGKEIVYAGLGGSVEDYTKAGAAGKIALVDRGTYTFVSKSANAKKAGAIGLLIANNADGELSMAIDSTGVPTYGITKAEGALIKQEINAGRNTVNFEVKWDTSNLLAGFSSRGPALPELNIKPDVLAPGVGINSSVPVWESSNGYTKLNGTSMASPHVAGAAALLLDWDKNLTPDQVKVLLSNSATPIKDRTGKYYSVYEQGAGLIDLSKVIAASSFARVAEVLDTGNPAVPTVNYDTGSLSFGLQSVGTVTKTVYVDPISKAPKTYSVSVDWRTAEHKGISLPAFSDITAGGYFNVPLTIDATAAPGFYEATLTLTEVEGQETLTLPIGVVVGDKYKPDALTNLYVGQKIISPNNDGYLDNTDFSFSVNEPINSLHIEVADVFTGTVVGDVYATGEKYYRGFYETTDWDGTVVDQKTKKPLQLPDGIYSITPVLNGTAVPDDQTISIVVDRTAPVVTGLTITEHDRTTAEEPRSATISGFIADDLLLELVAAGQDPNKLFGAAAVFTGANGKLLQADGVIDPSGYFEIEVPLAEGLNQFYIYVYDTAGNGAADGDYAQLLRYSTDANSAKVTPAASPIQAVVGQPVTIDVGFSVTDNVYGIYGATFNLYYSKNLNEPTIVPSVQLATYQETNFPGKPLPQFTNLIPLKDGQSVLQYGVHVTDGAYTGTGNGSLGKFTFTPASAGTYTFKLSDVLLWSDSYSATVPAGLSTVNVVVTNPVPSGPAISTGGSAPAVGTTLTAGQLVETANPAGGKPTAVLAVSDTALTAALQKVENNTAVISVSDLDFTKYGEVKISLTSAQAEKLKTAANALSINGAGFTLLIPAGTLPDFITSSGLAVTVSLVDSKDKAALSGSTATVDLGFSLLTIKNGWSTGKPVTVQIHLNDAGKKDVRKAGVYKQTTDSKWTYFQAGTLPKDGLLQFTITGDGTYSAAVRNVTFIDLSVHWAKEDIEILAAHGIVAGKGTDGSFKPSDSLNQAELLTLFDRLLGKGDTWSTRIKEAGSRDVLTREEAAVILANALGADSSSSATLTFKDAGKISANAKNAISFAVSKGYLKGEGANTFNPQGTLTRAQAAAILHRVLEDLRSK
ncbi:S8 family serine peptidase [Paenibacillus sp. BAC0078]